MLLLIVVASAVKGSRWTVCHGGCGHFVVAAFGNAQDCGARSPLAEAVVEAGCSCCAHAPEPDAASESHGPPVSEAQLAGCCGAEEGDAPEPAPRGALLPERPGCCSVLELGLEEGRTAEVDRTPLEAQVAWVGAPSLALPSVHRTACLPPLGRAPPRADRTTALRACTVLLI